MRWRCSAVRRVHMQRRLRLNIDNDGRVCGNYGHLRCLWCRLSLRRQWCASGIVFMLTRVCVDLDDIKCLRNDVSHMCDDRLRRRERVRRRISATGRLHVQPRLRLNVYNDDRVCGNHGHLRCLWCRLQLCGKWRAGSAVFVFAWVCVDLDNI